MTFVRLSNLCNSLASHLTPRILGSLDPWTLLLYVISLSLEPLAQTD